MGKSSAQRENGQLLVTRRAFLYGTAGAAGTLAATGALAAVGLGATGCSAIGGQSDDVDYLKVSTDSLVTLNDFEALESPEGKIQLIGQHEIPYGSLVWATDDEWAACLLPTDSGSPLTQVGLLSLGSGMLNVVLGRAVSFTEHYEIYDVRATSTGMIWTEANVLKGSWRIYTAKLKEGAIEGEPVLAEEGDSSYETPTLAVADNRAYWQLVPKLKDNPDRLASRLMAASFGRDSATCVYENERRMVTPPYSAADSVTITPRLNISGSYHRLTNIGAKSDDVEDMLTLPGGMAPLEAGYGPNGFMFSFSNIYDYGEGISNLGTYTPLDKSSAGAYEGSKWFGFTRTPTAAPAWCKDLLIIKSTYSVCGVDLDKGEYFAIDVDNGADDYGDYLATSGTRTKFVTYANIDHQPIGAAPVHACRVKIWTTIS